MISVARIWLVRAATTFSSGPLAVRPAGNTSLNRPTAVWKMFQRKTNTKKRPSKNCDPKGHLSQSRFFSPSPARQPGCFCQAIGCFYSRDCLGTAGRAEKDGNVQLRRQTRAAPEFMQMSVRHLSALRCFFLNRRWTERPIHIKHGRCCTAIRVRESRKREHDANYHSRNLDGSILYDRLFCRRLF